MIGIAMPTIIANEFPIWERLVFLFGLFFSFLYPLSASILVWCLSRMVSTMLGTLGNNNETVTSEIKMTANHWKVCLIQWRHSYQVISDLVDKINQCFGPVLMIMIVTSFVRFINEFFFILTNVGQEKLERSEIHNIIHLLCILSVVAIHNFALMYAAHGMRKQVQ